MPRLVECVPNFSEGRNRAAIDAIAGAITAVPGVTLLDVDPGAATNRTVYTFVGAPEAVADAAIGAARAAATVIDMSKHRGEHPRIGALDVCPFVPVSGVTMDECVRLAREVGRRIGEELKIPIYFYEYAATREERRSLADIRAGEYEGLERKLLDPAWTPDCGPAVFDRRLGATVVGAREFLIAYNVNLNTRDKRLAHEIALRIREAGRLKRRPDGEVVVDAAGQQVKTPGRLKAVRAIGWYIDEYRQAQVSINLLNYKVTPLHVVFETVVEEAASLGLRVTGSEVVGMVPLSPIVEAGRFYLRRQGKSSGAPEGELVDLAIRSLGLDQLAPFDAGKKVVEYAVGRPAPLATMSVRALADEVSSSSPAPGGGSAAALIGALAAALAAMVANLSAGKRREHADALSAMAERAQAIKRTLVEAIDEDTNAFNGLMQAMRLPRGTAGEQGARDAAIQEATRRASLVPLETARASLEAIELAGQVGRLGIAEAASDLGVAAAAGRAAVEGAVLNVLTNLGTIDDDRFVADTRLEAGRLIDAARRAADELTERVRGQFT
ncbi:MAG TPA: glutamate formimidoyltransferase [Vicinamibacterales bacterium]|jgi:glutamate formiminotransferase/formiminotetrahydrofolate cyclodeaminase